MDKTIIKQSRPLNLEVLRVSIAFVCTIGLYFLTFYGLFYYLQLAVFLLLLFISRDILGEGFDALGRFEIRYESLAFISSIAALMNGLASWSVENYFALSSLNIFLLLFGRYIEKRFFLKWNNVICISDSVSRFALLLSLALFVITVIVSLGMRMGIASSLEKGTAVLALSCPPAVCIVGIVTACAGAKAAQSYGIDIRNSTALERAGRISELILEPSGTVLQKETSLYDVYAVDLDKERLLSAAAAIEARAQHKFARAVVDAAESVGAQDLNADEFCEISGKGAAAVIDGDKYFLGNKRFMLEENIEIPFGVAKTSFCGSVPVYMAKNGKFYGVLLFENKQETKARDVMYKIGKLGIRRILLSDRCNIGDRQMFDVFFSEREKVLQELKKGDKIRTMVVSHRPIAEAHTVCTFLPSDKSDVCISDINGVLYTILIGKRVCGIVKPSLAVALVLSAASALTVTGFFGSVMPCSAINAVAVLPLVFAFFGMLTICKFSPPDITSEEDDGMFGKVNYTMKINGMSCAHCSARVKTALESIRGVSAKISLEEKAARIKCPLSTDTDALLKAVTDAGFTVASLERV